MQTEIESLKAQVLNLQSTTLTLAAAVPVTPLTPPPTVNDVVHELKLRTSKETNIIISSIFQSISVSDAQLATNFLLDELNVTTMVTYCLRLGKSNVGRPQLLFATLAHASYATKFIRLARPFVISETTTPKTMFTSTLTLPANSVLFSTIYALI